MARYVSGFRGRRDHNVNIGFATDGIWPKCELIQVFMVALVTCKNEEDTFKKG